LRNARPAPALVNAHAQPVENHAHSLAIHTVHDSFVRIRQTRGCTPAMAENVLADRVKVLDDWEASKDV